VIGRFGFLTIRVIGEIRGCCLCGPIRHCQATALPVIPTKLAKKELGDFGNFV
jgi:hypothetical protein